MTMTVSDLKDLLQQALDNLENYDDNQKLEIKTNTYWVRGDFISITGKGFVQLNDPVATDDDEDEEDC